MAVARHSSEVAISNQDVASNDENHRAAIDIEGLVMTFVQDATQTSMELPKLTTGQRKQVKVVAEQHEALVCESFGFGQDRRLHLFKKSPAEATKVGPQVAIAPDVLACCADLSEEVESDGRQSGSTSARGSRPESISGDWTHLAPSTPASSVLPELPDQPQEIKMRNTFVHFGSRPDDERAVQSMPHGMFGLCLSSELAALPRISSPSSASCDGISVEDQHAPRQQESYDSLSSSVAWQTGTQVMIQGLVKCPAFNRHVGVVQSFDAENGRYDVLLMSAGNQMAKLKAENLCAIPMQSTTPMGGSTHLLELPFMPLSPHDRMPLTPMAR